VAHRDRAAAEVAQPGPEHHERAEHELRDDRAGALEHAVRHRDHEQRHGEDDRDRRIAAQRARVLAPRVLDRLQPRATGGRVEHVGRHLVAGVADRIHELRAIRCAGDPRVRRHQIHVGARDTGHRTDRLLDAPHARRTRHSQHGNIEDVGLVRHGTVVA
jgi:hypothetical protein